jgi:RND family efflux transporter MFP subunit
MWRSSIVLLLMVAACNKSAGEKSLPPAKGEGAPPAPVLPKIETKGEGATAAIAATEGHTTGTTFPHQEAQLGPMATGVITDVAVEEGQAVRKGQILFRLDPRDGELRIAQAKAALAAAEVGLRAVTTEYERGKQLMEQNAMNRAQWDQVVARLDGAKVGVDQAKVALQMAEKSLTDTVVRAPFDGVVTAKMKTVGELATMMPPTVVIVLQQHSILDLRFRLPEKAVSLVRAGDPVRLRFDALGLTREAKIARVQPSVDAHTRTVEIVAELPNADLALRPGLLAEVEIGAQKEVNAP